MNREKCLIIPQPAMSRCLWNKPCSKSAVVGHTFCSQHVRKYHDKYLIVNRNNQPMCHIVGCWESTRLESCYGGQFCAKHVHFIESFRRRMGDNNSALLVHASEATYRKTPSTEHVCEYILCPCRDGLVYRFGNWWCGDHLEEMTEVRKHIQESTIPVQQRYWRGKEALLCKTTASAQIAAREQLSLFAYHHL